MISSSNKLLVVGTSAAVYNIVLILHQENVVQETTLMMDRAFAVKESHLNHPLIRKDHLGKPMVIVIKKLLLEILPWAKIHTIDEDINRKLTDNDLISEFTLVVNVLESKTMQSQLQTLCVALNIPLVQCGGAENSGQLKALVHGKIEVLNCRPELLIPTQPVHCVLWAKSLYCAIFGEVDPKIGADGDSGVTACAGGNPMLSGSLRKWAESVLYEPMTMFRKFFSADVKELALNIECGSPPTPLDWESLSDEVLGSDNHLNHDLMEDQLIWSAAVSGQIFRDAINELVSFAQPEKYGSSCYEEALDFITASSNLRATAFGIPPLSKYDVEGSLNDADITEQEMIKRLATLIKDKAPKWMAVASAKNENPSEVHKHCVACFHSACQFAPCPVVKCPNVCGASFHGCKTEEHAMLCQKEVVGCLNSAYGCTHTMARRNMSDHLPSCPANVVVCRAAAGCQSQWHFAKKPCLKLLRRDMYASHVKDLHGAILNNMVFWLEKCPLLEASPTARGPRCGPRHPLIWQRAYPDTPMASIKYMEDISMFCIHYNTGVKPHPNGRVVHDFLSAIPVELQLSILEYLDPLSLNCLRRTSTHFQSLCELYWVKKGIVSTQWQKVGGGSAPQQWIAVHNRLFPHHFAEIRCWGHHPESYVASHLAFCTANIRVHHIIPYDLSNRYPVPKLLEHLMGNKSEEKT